MFEFKSLQLHLVYFLCTHWVLDFSTYSFLAFCFVLFLFFWQLSTVFAFFFVTVFHVPSKTRPQEPPDSSTSPSLVHCCLVFMPGCSFTNIKLQHRRCDTAGLPLPCRNPPLTSEVVVVAHMENTLELFLGTGWWWHVPARSISIFSLTLPLVSEDITKNNLLWRYW